MTICNMSIEAGARAGMIAPDATTFAYLKGRRFSPHRPGCQTWDRHASSAQHWSATCNRRRRNLRPRTHHQRRRHHPHRLLGHLPRHGHRRQVHRPHRPTPTPPKPTAKTSSAPSNTWASKPAQPIEDIKIDRVFLGSCTNARIEDLRAAAAVVRGYHVATTVRAMVVPGSQSVKAQAESEGLDQIFKTAGFDWREPGCSMCLGMNPDILAPGERCASTSNRNFEGRQGRGGRTHLVSPQMAAAAAITGHFTDIRNWQFKEKS